MHRRHLLRSSVVMVLAVVVMGSTWQHARAESPTVTTTADSGPGSLRAAIASASPGDTITFGLTGTIVLTSGEITIDKNLSIDGRGASRLAINGNNNSRIFTVAAGATVTVSNLTITRGHPRNLGMGGGILNLGNLTLAHVAVTNNQSDDGEPGGGIYNRGTLTVTNSIISGNWSPDSAGGGIENWTGASATINLSLISSNRAALPIGGNGIDNEGMMTITASTISGNSGGHGGGISNRAGQMTITASTITGNTAVDGAGGIDNGASLRLVDSVVTGNFVTHKGTTGIDNHGTLVISNSTITRNIPAVVIAARG